MRILWAADTLSVTSPSMRGAWYGLSTAIVAAIQAAYNIILIITFLVYPLLKNQFIFPSYSINFAQCCFTAYVTGFVHTS